MPGLRAEIYECQVVVVHEEDRTIDAVSRSGTEFMRLSYLLPWISANGSGIDFVPSTGDQCLVLASSVRGPVPFSQPEVGRSDRGRFAICVGFHMPSSPGSGGQHLAGRMPGLPQGSMVIRSVTEDGNEALLLVTRGGTAVIGASGVCKTVYSPIDNSMSSIFDNFEMTGPGGRVSWTRNGESVRYEAQYRVNTSETSGRLDIVIDGDSEKPLEVTFGQEAGRPSIKISVDRYGEAHIEGEIINISARSLLNIDGAEIWIKGRQVLGQGDPI